MRLRNVKNAKEILEDSKYYVKDPIKFRGSWNDNFERKTAIMLEIGMGKGDFLIGMAKNHPEFNFVGIEMKESILVRASQKLESETLPNVRIVNWQAENLDKIFDYEIDTIYLNFSDPWPKTRHHKRRLTYESFLKVYERIFALDAKIVMKTDNDGLFESSLESLSKYGYILDKVYLDLWSHDEPNIKTEYENKFGNMGYKIKYLEAHKTLRVGKTSKK